MDIQYSLSFLFPSEFPSEMVAKQPNAISTTWQLDPMVTVVRGNSSCYGHRKKNPLVMISSSTLLCRLPQRASQQVSEMNTEQELYMFDSVITWVGA